MNCGFFRRLGAPLAVAQLIEGNIATHGWTHHGWKYSCIGTRKSGDPYTSLMNSVINGISHYYLYCKWTKKSVLQSQKTLAMLVQGDDNLLWHQERERFPWQTGMAGLGFESKAIYRNHWDEAEFCSCRLYKTNDGYVFGPKPGKVLAKFGYIINPPKNASRASMMRGVALGLAQAASFIPPLQVVVDRVLELTDGVVPTFQKKTHDDFMISVSKRHSRTPDIDLALYKAYYWSHGTQRSWAKKVSQMQLGDTYGPYSQLLFDRDTSGPSVVFVAG